jgi:hypothetical protein
MTNEFYINDIKIIIGKITPIEFDADNSDIVSAISVTYAFKYNDIADVENNLGEVNEIIQLKINISNLRFEKFIELDDLTKELFYPIAKNEAEISQIILDKINAVRIRRGLDIAPPRIIETNKRKNLPFK